MTNLKEMYLELREPVFRYLLHLSGGNIDLAEDLTQETFYRAILALPGFRKESSVKTWLFSIARNIYLHKIRDEVKQKTPFLDDKISHAAELLEDPQSCLEKAEQDKAAARALYALPEIYRTVVALRISDNLSYAEIASILGKTENWARVTFFRAKQLMRKAYFKKEGGEMD